MNTCKDCKFWKPIESEEPLGTCEKAESTNGKPTGGATLAFADATDNLHRASAIFAWLITSPSFGCNQFEHTTDTQ
jgi:hypothetical protein